MNALNLLIQTTKGIIRDQAVRRMAMFVVLIVAMAMLFAGATFLNNWLYAHLAVFVIYWGTCAWLTMTVMLLAIFDLLTVRLQLRREKRRLRTEIFGKDKDDTKP